MEWKEIESAPRDGQAILVSNMRGGVWVAKYEPVYQSGYRPENPWFSLMLNHEHCRPYVTGIPTHWQPLPSPPHPTPPHERG